MRLGLDISDVENTMNRLMSRVSRRCDALHTDHRGAAVVEFAIIFPVLIVLLFGVIDFGRAFFLRNNLVAAAREGARSGAVMSDPCASDATDLMRARVREYVSSFGGATPTDGQIQVTTPGGCAANTATNVRVQVVDYAFTPLTPVFRMIDYTSALRITVSAVYRWEQSPVP
jgi:Flp pilus assembly protein TadG